VKIGLWSSPPQFPWRRPSFFILPEKNKIRNSHDAVHNLSFKKYKIHKQEQDQGQHKDPQDMMLATLGIKRQHRALRQF
jgi:hypothetical protein